MSAPVKMQCTFNNTVLTAVLPPWLITEVVIGSLGNGFALWIFCFHLKPWKSSTVLLFSLAIADFLLLLPLPLRAIYYNSNFEWKYGRTLCDIGHFMVAMNRTGSTLFLIAIALDRYMRVVHPHHRINFLSVTKAACGAAVLWLLTILMSAFVTISNTNKGYCGNFTSQVVRFYGWSWHGFAFLFAFYLPFLAIVYCTVNIIRHLRKRQIAQQARIKKALWLLITIVILFTVCFFPSNLTHLTIWFKAINRVDSMSQTEICAEMEQMAIVHSITLSFTYLNSALDPVVYYFSSSVFYNICRKALHLKEPSETVETKETSSQSVSQPL